MFIVYSVIAIGIGTLLAIMIGMAIRDSKIINATRPTQNAIILPYIPMPSTLTELAEAYTIIINAPFAEAREGFGRTVNTVLYPTLQPDPPKQHDRADIIYDGLCRCVALIHIGVFIACFGLGVLVHEPDFIIAYLGCFCMWTIWTIVRYPYTSFIQKIALVLFVPSMAWYFFYRLATAPVRRLSRLAA